MKKTTKHNALLPTERVLIHKYVPSLDKGIPGFNQY